MGHILLTSSQIRAWGNVHNMFIPKWDLYLQSKVGELCCDRITISTSLNPLMKRGPSRTDCERACSQMLKHKKQNQWRIPWFCCTFVGVTTNLSSYCSFQKSGDSKGVLHADRDKSWQIGWGVVVHIPTLMKEIQESLEIMKSQKLGTCKNRRMWGLYCQCENVRYSHLRNPGKLTNLLV